MTTSTGRPALALAVALTALGLTACSGAEASDDATSPAAAPTSDATTSTPASPSPSPSASATPTPTPAEPTAPAGPTIPGYAYGEVPPVPLLVMPDLSLLSSTTPEFTRQAADQLATQPGVTVTAATCDASGAVTADGGAYLAYGDGSGSYTGPDGAVRNYGDGSGSLTIDGVTANNYGDGSGSYDSADVSIWNYGDGSGSYTDADSTIWIYGDGSGSETSSRGTVSFYGDGSASYDSGAVSIWNYGDGSASYTSPSLTVWNYGDGTGAVNGAATEVEPVPAAPLLGSFPPLADLAPLTSCGTLVTLDSTVLFDVDASAVRPDASAALDGLAATLTALGAPAATVQGHTDSVRDEAWNQTLSDNRASAVADALRARGVTTTLDAVGFGETRPVAPNEVDGVPDLAGRQLNRRVEIFVPAF